MGNRYIPNLCRKSWKLVYVGIFRNNVYIIFRLWCLKRRKKNVEPDIFIAWSIYTFLCRNTNTDINSSTNTHIYRNIGSETTSSVVDEIESETNVLYHVPMHRWPTLCFHTLLPSPPHLFPFRVRSHKYDHVAQKFHEFNCSICPRSLNERASHCRKWKVDLDINRSSAIVRFL